MNIEFCLTQKNRVHKMKYPKYLLIGIPIAMGTGPGSADDASSRPNIIFIFSDDHATHAVGAYGPKNNNPELHNHVHTPAIDRLASKGMLFRNVFCTNSICGPSRAAILTGKHSHFNGMFVNNTPFDGSQQTFPKLLQERGYNTAWIGKWHLFSDPTGFDHWAILTQSSQQGTYYNPIFGTNEGTLEPETGYTATLITDRAIEWVDNNRDSEKPFFLAFSHKTPHREWMPGPDEYDMYKDVDLPLPSNFYVDYSERTSAALVQEMEIARHMNERDLKLVPPFYLNEEQLERFMESYGPENEAFMNANLQGKELAEWKYQRFMKDYLRCVASMDKEIGRLLDYLDEAGLAGNTIVIYSSDQGFFLGDHGWYDKRWMYEESLRMPFIVRWPGVTAPGSENSYIVQNIDFASMFLDMAGASIPEDIQGKSLVPLLRGDNPPDWREYAYYHYYAYPDWHMVKPHYGIRSDRYKLIHYYTIQEWELFDLEKDPDELRSVYADPEFNEIMNYLKETLHKTRVSQGDTVIFKVKTLYNN
jgi:arylsulfatase A-like enzyme